MSSVILFDTLDSHIVYRCTTTSAWKIGTECLLPPAVSVPALQWASEANHSAVSPSSHRTIERPTHRRSSAEPSKATDHSGGNLAPGASPDNQLTGFPRPVPRGCPVAGSRSTARRRLPPPLPSPSSARGNPETAADRRSRDLRRRRRRRRRRVGRSSSGSVIAGPVQPFQKPQGRLEWSSTRSGSTQRLPTVRLCFLAAPNRSSLLAINNGSFVTNSFKVDGRDGADKRTALGSGYRPEWMVQNRRSEEFARQLSDLNYVSVVW